MAEMDEAGLNHEPPFRPAAFVRVRCAFHADVAQPVLVRVRMRQMEMNYDFSQHCRTQNEEFFCEARNNRDCTCSAGDETWMIGWVLHLKPLEKGLGSVPSVLRDGARIRSR